MPNAFDYASLSLGILILGFLWKFQRDVHRDISDVHRDIAGVHRDIAGVHRDIADLRERMARLEGLFEGFTKATPPQTPPAP